MDQFDETTRTIAGAIFGHAVGDALGVPVEFESRAELAERPITDMIGFGSHNQLAGTWSDDTSLALCTAESLCNGFSLDDMSDRFVRWLHEAHWTAHGNVFDVGMTTSASISRLCNGVEPTQAGAASVSNNGNGSLMRILPLALYLARANENLRRTIAMQCSCLTHGHIRSQLACAIFAELVSGLLNGLDFEIALRQTQEIFAGIVHREYPEEIDVFERVFSVDIGQTPVQNISGSGYVIDCLETSIWCCLNTNSFEEAVLTAVNLGEDTDTTGAVTGGMVGLIYGIDAIPISWIDKLARTADIRQLCGTFATACSSRWADDK